MLEILDLLPHATRPWRTPILRQHRPAPTTDYQDFRACLRWEFGFSCAFCLLHESDLSDNGTEGWGLMWIEHVELQSKNPELANDYDNCVYSCRFCNQARGAKRLIDSQQRHLLNPCHTAWEKHFYLYLDEIRRHDDNGDAVYTFQTYDLNDERKVRIRKKRRTVLSERLDVVTQARPLHDRLMQRARDTGDETLVDDAELAYEQFRQACSDLLRFHPIPDDAKQSCTCDAPQHHALPVVLQEQILRINTSTFSWTRQTTPTAPSP
jgi:hypothetical protein